MLTLLIGYVFTYQFTLYHIFLLCGYVEESLNILLRICNSAILIVTQLTGSRRRTCPISC